MINALLLPFLSCTRGLGDSGPQVRRQEFPIEKRSSTLAPNNALLRRWAMAVSRRA
jgi:hypothetical protein